jgi:hypothetical protein
MVGIRIIRKQNEVLPDLDAIKKQEYVSALAQRLSSHLLLSERIFEMHHDIDMHKILELLELASNEDKDEIFDETNER